MKVIMRKDVRGVGQKDSLQEVSDGYALNMLIPQGMAEQATPEKIAAVELRKKATAAKDAKDDERHAEELQKIKGKTVMLKAKANEQGHLYKQLSTEAIAAAVASQLAVQVPGTAIALKEPIKTTGNFSIAIRLGKSEAQLAIEVVGD